MDELTEDHVRTLSQLEELEAAAEEIMNRLRDAGMLYPADELSGL
jgi:bifunctional enzyme CysN/CysC